MTKTLMITSIYVEKDIQWNSTRFHNANIYSIFLKIPNSYFHIAANSIIESIAFIGLLQRQNKIKSKMSHCLDLSFKNQWKCRKGKVFFFFKILFVCFYLPVLFFCLGAGFVDREREKILPSSNLPMLKFIPKSQARNSEAQVLFLFVCFANKQNHRFRKVMIWHKQVSVIQEVEYFSGV